MFAEIITIGDELLIGQVVDTNSAWMAQKLNAIGIRVKQITSVSDNAAHIYKALTEAKERAEVVFITGGLGPTKDDITKSVLLDFFGGELEINEQALKNIHAIFARYNKPVLPANHQQAAVPSSCEIILNLQGTAPGMYFFQNNCHYFSMPGVPFEMIDMMENSIIPKLSQTLKLPFVLHETILTAGIGESFIADLIAQEEAQLPAHIQLAYLPKLGQVRLRLSAHGNNRSQLQEELNFYKTAIAAKLADNVVALRDINIEEVILQLLAAQNKSLATAESCTGGYIGHLLTAIPGSSKSYFGGGITYSYGLKESVLGVKSDTLSQTGAVSEETVTEMVLGALKAFNSDYAIACSGIAGPDGGTPDKPVGTVWIAVASKNKVVAKKFLFGNKRMQNIERTAVSALYMLYRLLKEN
jgi:nicotinamide-nucleotide amidase